MQSLRDILARIARGETTPAGALAVTAASQRIVERWVAANRPGTAAADAAAAAQTAAEQNDNS